MILHKFLNQLLIVKYRVVYKLLKRIKIQLKHFKNMYKLINQKYKSKKIYFNNINNHQQLT